MFKKNFLSTTITRISLMGLGLGMTVSGAISGVVARIETGDVILRKGPAMTYQAIARVPTGEKVQIDGCLPGKAWCSLRYNGIAGWAAADYFAVGNVPVVSLSLTPARLSSSMTGAKRKMNQIASGVAKTKMQKHFRTDVIITPTGVKKTDERTILNPLLGESTVSVHRVAAYNPLFPNDVNFRNAERNETRYRVVTYPAPRR
ncbi:SH3-domain protein [Bartonella australis AUST/NH1]|uniref:SH3-domain protein n=1 Tax=Bartonella australis (strain Aust/NH1) TaxID=1094489 RepID=M1N4R0_BARAA|nr:SH3 domain-containing protein [Bartonella australis]AGF74884.1 SH3-domain protein [Bartonella australis AUST/NH1]